MTSPAHSRRTARRTVVAAAAALGAAAVAVLAPGSWAGPARAARPAVAFDGAVGYGATATGGAGGNTYHVTNLNDSGSGSFRDAVSASHRIVVFDVGGYITLNSAVSVADDITIEGDTAPGQGIGLRGREVSFSNSSNDIVRYVRFREGTLDPANGKASLALARASDMIFDHVSVEFAKWDDIDAVGAKNITVQDSIIADPIGQRFAAHTEGGPFTWYHDVFADAHNRNPLAKADTQFVGNVVYDYQGGYTAGNSGGTFRHDVADNAFIAGPVTGTASNAYYQMAHQTVWNSGNILDGDKDGKLGGTALGVGAGATGLASPWSPTTASLAASAASARDAYAQAVAQAGDLPRDDVDSLVIADVTSLGTGGRLWSSQTQTGLGNDGYGTITG
ncbi:hypothetical protein A6P39_039685 [Streptomyces sp. FXJ1.172]|uniref:hypothetical protein n=1 Tax=Streptomyces sp. FXJ1.172 TaxID=710705 RepID=UPI0007CF0BE0|nr:hypothetical protein [Streptomyces sp. FXJ1.172]WEO99684.1 hypothetical protein A6P39_039685 [Streptomyces sp. FXJ1.172]